MIRQEVTKANESKKSFCFGKNDFKQDTKKIDYKAKSDVKNTEDTRSFDNQKLGILQANNQQQQQQKILYRCHVFLLAS